MFLHTYTQEHKAKIRASHYCSIDYETTGLTPTSTPVAMKKTTKIGHQTFAQYKAANPDCTLDCSLRARILSVGIHSGEVLVFDLDKLEPDSRVELVRDTINGKILIGHNLAFDLAWSVAIAGHDIQPRLVLDTLLLARVIKPGITFKLHKMAAMGHADSIEIIEKTVTSCMVSLAALSASHNLGQMDKAYQKPANWCLSVLSQGHYDYVVGDVMVPVQLFKSIIGCPDDLPFINMLHLLREIDDTDCGGTYARIYQHVPLTLAKMAQRGIPVHEETLANVEAYRSSTLQGLVEDLIVKIPAMETCRSKLESTQAGVTAELKEVLGAYAKENGYTLAENEKGQLIVKSKDVRINGASTLDGWKAWDLLQHTKKILSLCSEFRGVSKPHPEFAGFRKLIPAMSATAVTLRTITGEPNVQNLPRPQRGLDESLQFRSIVKAPDGYSIVINDYGQIELRIAAALSIRTLKIACDIKNGGSAYGVPDWIRKALVKGDDFDAVLKTEGESFTAFADKFSMSYRNVLQKGTLMAEAFKAGVDPHLLSGLNMAVGQGKFNTGGMSPLAYLMSLSKDDAKALTKTLKTQRQSAKALNFGLLYGMQAEGLWALGVSDYGLDWTLDEAKAARAQWFELYPEIAFWQDFIRVVTRQHASDGADMMIRNRYTKKMETRSVRLGFSHTLSGRPVVAELPREIGNYSDQGSGADMMLEAIITLEPKFRDCVINTIHDEVMMLVRDEDVPAACVALEKAMIDAANRVLAPYGIPAEAKPDVVKFWRKVD